MLQINIKKQQNQYIFNEIKIFFIKDKKFDLKWKQLTKDKIEFGRKWATKR